MPPYTTSQKHQIAEFVNCTRTKESVATKFLKACGWSLPPALDAFFAAASGTSATITSELTKIFESYRDDPVESPDTIGITRAIDFLGDLGVELDEVTCLAIAELLHSPSMGEFTREGWMEGWLKVLCDTMPKMQAHAKLLRERIPREPETFRRVYRYAFPLSRMQGQRNLQFEIATEQWRLFFTPDHGGVAWNTETTPWLDWWIQFLEERGKKPVNKDLWEQVEVFMRKSLEDEEMGWWSPDGAWPGALDDFVAWVQAKRGKGSEMEVE
ncbi:Scaffold-type E3 ligase [Penicillium rubens]|uniref:Defective in cullin neddylation protein n=2 Tax=Penicillium chrysogenum species complex TaxID=254878 RepID=B6HJ43_PENRW|nr:uncharacterized protein N7525_006612 [Penicillium rubens]KAJ5268915.1 hypothetical protein N7505_004673 [Penicillium chrysogenum]CAP96828.1 Pc21g19310 [Penicillium rubens Wisconsin 54-1255]KAF3019180.1 Scaffold-type E3 ligase [Penicillium rubens]KAJ5049946.1 Scaffold-type E3 ligase [Penicillium rubens]KAJ5828359.1 hypothetical protein N7525_006612 [Penicillium rubens]